MTDETELQEGSTRIALDRLPVGWVVDRDIYAGHQLLLSAGTQVTPSIIEALRKRNIDCLDVRPDSELAQSESYQASDALTNLLAQANVIRELHGVRTFMPEAEIERAAKQVEAFFGEVELGQEVDFGEIRATIRELIQRFLEHQDLAVKLLDLDRTDRYTYRHSINAGLLFLVVARDWFEPAELEDAVFGAMLHDLGKAKVGHEIINKPGQLTQEEWDTMRRHPVWSHELLLGAGTGAEALSIARSHHERVDGKGYPDGAPAMYLSRATRLAAVCDVYDALTTQRSYKGKMDFALAIDVIIQNSGTHFDPEIANRFIRRIGRYPVGTFVRLASGETGVVVRVNEHSVNLPVVSRVMSREGQLLIAPEELDLALQNSNYITGVIPAPGRLAG